MCKPSSGTWVFAEKNKWQKESLEFDIMETWISVSVPSHSTSLILDGLFSFILTDFNKIKLCLKSF